jgi:hypothetical protein
MALLPLKLPPGVFRSGTEYSSAGRWYDANLVRFYQTAIRPMGGWRELLTATVSGAPRALYTWRANNATRWVAVGTHTGLYAIEGGITLYDITPASFVTGRADAGAANGYGTGAYGRSTYGDARPATTVSGILDATIWSLDNWGQNLVAVSPSDGRLVEWSLNTANDAVAIANSPTSCTALVVTAERILVALGAGGNPRRIQWSDQENNTVWTPSGTNQAGDFEFQTNGTLKRGLRVRGGTLYLTDVDAWFGVYQGPPLVFGFDRVGTGCGIVGSGAAAALDTSAVWMGEAGFWIFDGYTKPLPCEVGDYVFGDINRSQISKVAAVVNTTFGEVSWYYPSGSSTENDRYVTWSYRENHWTIGALARTAGDDSGVFDRPILMAPNGQVWQHEVGWAYPGSVEPFLEGGPVELGTGDDVYFVRQLIPDEATTGQVEVTFYPRLYPNAARTTVGPYSLSARTDTRLTGRQINMRITGDAATSWRFGVPRIDVVPRGRR